jgi:hypothetical protein
MGEAPASVKEHILCLLPFPEDTKVLDSIRKKHPNVEFTYKQIRYEHGKPVDLTTLPDGCPTL